MPKELSERSARAATEKATALSIITGPFASHLATRGCVASTIRQYQLYIRYAARRLARRGFSLMNLRAPDVARFFPLSPGRPGGHAREALHMVLHRWFEFRGLDPVPRLPQAAWQPWLDEFAKFLVEHKGFVEESQRSYVGAARRFLTWRFQSSPARWSEVRPAHILRFAEIVAGEVKASTCNFMLLGVRTFLNFVHLRGRCPAELAHAMPRVANYGNKIRPRFLTPEQKQRLLAAFDRRTPLGRRDYAMALCMVDLGLRAVEVTRLRLCDADFTRQCLHVPPAKNSSGRDLPLLPHVGAALQAYLSLGRPQSVSDQLFLRERWLRGHPISGGVVRDAMRAAYRRGGLPSSWSGTHRLRHTFATRQYARGTPFKQIADLLGHRNLDSTLIYTHVDLQGLRQLVQPWPC